jgi:mitochondrial fission protein ELM1
MPESSASDERNQSRTAAQIWVVSDGTAGMRLQSVALAEALLRARPGWSLEEFTITPHPLVRALPRLAAALPGLPLYGGPNVNPGANPGVNPGGLALARRPHAGHYPDILITCGRRMAGFALALKRRAKADGYLLQIVHCQDPRLSPSLFDAVLVPRHDRARGPNVLVTTGSLNRLTLVGIQAAMMEMPSRWLETTRRTAVAVMLGGDNRRYKVRPEMGDAMAERLAGFARASGAMLMIMASRRTPDGLVDQICAKLPPGAVMLPQDGEPNVYPGILGMAQAVIVSSDSVNMASEAAITGKPVMIAPWRPATDANPTGETGRIRAFHDHMFAGKHTVPLATTIPNGPFERLDEMTAVTDDLLKLLER